MATSRSCPTESTLAAFHEHELSAKDQDDIATHLEGCARCEEALSTLSPPEKARAPAGELEPGAKVGRFIVERRLGAGGMGVVYAAQDPQLRRRVAVKLLRGAATSAGRARLLREAQAMARLQHPNVVVVYEAGEVEEQVFVAMELVDGESLDQWLARRKPAWRDLLDAFLQAGRGLAAAHAAGIVHRDFKPANVLVGNDGRVRVGDFGLAREEGELSGAGDPSAPDSPLTQTGAVLGTPAYMSPEQRRGERATAAADIYSYCVALYEGLYGVRPGAKAPARSDVPTRVGRAVVRGLSPKIEDRPATMNALLEALSVARRRTPYLAAGLAAAVAVAAGAFVWSRSPTPSCTGIAARLGGIWDAPRKQAVHKAFTDTGLPVAEARWQKVEVTIDRYASAWVEKSAALCAATEVRHQMAPEERALRQRCLDQRLEKLRAWVGVMQVADAQKVRGSVDSASSRDSLTACDDAAPPVAPTPADPTLAAKVQDLRNQFEALSVRGRLGEMTANREPLKKLYEDAKAVGYKPLECELLEQMAMARMREHDFGGAVPLLEDLRRLAEEARYDRLRALAWIDLSRAHSWLHKPAEAHQAARDAQSIIGTLGAEEATELRVALAAAEADAFWEERKFPEAVAQARLAVEGLEKLYGPNDTRVAARLAQLGGTLRLAGKLDEAQAAYERGIRLIETAGADEDNALVPELMTNLADLATERGEWNQALDYYSRATARLDRAAGADHPATANARLNSARCLVTLHRAAEALPLLAEARRVFEAKLPPDSPDLGELYWVLGSAYAELKDGTNARPWLEKAESLMGPAQNELPTRVAELRFLLAQVIWDTDRRGHAKARELAVAAEKDADENQRPEMVRWLASHR